MYENIGGKIKGLAKAGFIISAIASVIAGIVLWVVTEEGWCALILFGGPVLAWVSSWLLYGYGEIIDKISDLHTYNIGNTVNPSEIKKENNCLEFDIKKDATIKQESKKKEERVMVEEDNMVVIKCPECKEKLFFDKDFSQAECPYCGCNIKIK
ncbi:MAG TPA: hypothetical protein DDY70_04210 [Clostridiales bacterium]|nr:hypothetical protein [Clostridiales bacterium]